MSFPYWQVLSMHMHSYLFYSQTNASNVQLALSNITADPEERHDLNRKLPEELKSLLARVRYHMKGVVPPPAHTFDPKALSKAVKEGVWCPWLEYMNFRKVAVTLC